MSLPDQRKTRKEALAVAVAVVRSELDPLLGARLLVRALHRLGLESDPRFIVLRGVDSESDDLPLEATERAAWAPHALALKDREASAYSARVRAAVRDACEALVLELAEGGEGSA